MHGAGAVATELYILICRQQGRRVREREGEGDGEIQRE